MSGLFDQITNYSPPLLTAGQVNYKGTWDAAANSPTLTSPPAATTKGDYYVVGVAGTQFTISFAVGDWIISNGTAWEKVDLTDAVSSVFGRTGAVVGASTDYSSVGLTNTAIGASSPSTGAFTTVTASSTIAATGAVTGSNLSGTHSGTSSGTNTGDQTITLTGGVTGSGTGSFAATVVTNANLTGAITSVGNATSLGSFSSANLASALTDETGSGAAVFATSPTLTTPILGTPSSGTLSSCTGLPISTGVSGLGTGIATALAVNTGSAGAPVLFNGALGTPTSGTVTNLTGTASININGTVGATTASTGAFTTLSASGLITSTVPADSAVSSCTTGTTGFLYHLLQNTSGVSIFGLNGSTNTLGGTNSSAYDTVIRGNNISFSANNGTATQARLTSTGLAVTGALSSTTGANFATSSGSVGVGTASPAYKLDITDNSTGVQQRLISSSTSGTSLALNNTATNGRIYRIGSNFVTGNGEFALYDDTAGAARITVSSTGNVGIGVTPTSKLHILTSGTAFTVPAQANTGGSSALRINAVGSEPGFMVHTDLNGSGSQTGTATASLGLQIGFYTTNDLRSQIYWAGTPLTFTYASTPTGSVTERMRIDSSGNLLVGTTSFSYNPNNGVTLAGDSIGAVGIGHASGTASGNGYANFAYAGSNIGSITQTGTTAVLFNTTSDYRLKEITGPLVDSGTFIDALKPKIGTWKADGSKFVGFIAHEFAEVSPTSVTGVKDAVDAEGKPIYQAMQAGTSEVIANLVAELQSVRQRLAVLETN
jgi:hypothetical protein